MKSSMEVKKSMIVKLNTCSLKTLLVPRLFKVHKILNKDTMKKKLNETVSQKDTC